MTGGEGLATLDSRQTSAGSITTRSCRLVPVLSWSTKSCTAARPTPREVLADSGEGRDEVRRLRGIVEPDHRDLFDRLAGQPAHGIAYRLSVDGVDSRH